MNVYHFSYSVSKTEIEVKDNTNTIIGSISRIEIKECEKNRAFSFQNINNSCVKIGIKKRNAREFFAPKYIILTEQGSYMLQDRTWRNLLYFSVSGSIDKNDIIIEENGKGDVEIKRNCEQVAVISFGIISSKTTIHVAKHIDTSSVLVAIAMLFPFMYKIYEDEASFFENIIDELI